MRIVEKWNVPGLQNYGMDGNCMARVRKVRKCNVRGLQDYEKDGILSELGEEESHRGGMDEAERG